MTSILLILICTCGLKGPLYFLVKATVQQKAKSTIFSKEREHQLIQTETVQKSSNENSQLIMME